MHVCLASLSFTFTQLLAASLVCNLAKPVCSFVKVNTDAHVVKGEYVSLWLVCRYDTGKVLLAAPKRLEVDWDLAMAEGAASRYGI